MNAPTNEIELEKMSWAATQRDNQYARTALLRARDEYGYLSLPIGKDGEMIYFLIRNNGANEFVGSEPEMLAHLEARKAAKARAAAGPDVSWKLGNGAIVNVWKKDAGFSVQMDKGEKVYATLAEVPAKKAEWAKQNGVVAVLAARTMDFALTVERKALIDAIK